MASFESGRDESNPALLSLATRAEKKGQFCPLGIALYVP